MSNGDAGQTNLALVQCICGRCVLKASNQHQRSRADLRGSRRRVFTGLRRAAARAEGTGHVTEFRRGAHT